MANESCSFIKDELAPPTLKGSVWQGQIPSWQSLFHDPLCKVIYSHIGTQNKSS